MKLIFSCSISISHSFERYRVEHSKINFISLRAHVLFSISFLEGWRELGNYPKKIPAQQRKREKTHV